MTNELIKAKEHAMEMWYDENQLAEIRKIACRGASLTDIEFQYLVQVGRTTQLNPFNGEIWAIKYKEGAPATIFIGRDGYRKCAQRDADYDFHQSDAVYSNDKFVVVDGIPKHQYTLTDRGKLIGAYCIAKRKKSSRPVYVFCELAEYKSDQGLWKGSSFNPAKPATMIKKVAESQCLRACFQDLLGGTYGEEEIQERHDYEDKPKAKDAESLMNKIKTAKGTIIDAEVETGELASKDQLADIHALMAVKVFESGRLPAAMTHYGVETLAQLTSVQADDFISKLNKLADRQ